MWSDRAAPQVNAALVDELRSVLNPGVFERPQPGFAIFGQRLFAKPLATLTAWDGYTFACGQAGTVSIPGKALDVMRAALEAWNQFPGAVLAGFLSYDLAAEIEDIGPLPPANFDFPRLHFGLYLGSSALPEDRAADSSPVQSFGPLVSHPDRSGFESAVARTVAAIHAGDIFQTNLCRTIEVQLGQGAESRLFNRLRAVSPARYESFIAVDTERCVLSISPELFLKVNAGIVESHPIKGTRPRGATPEEDATLASALLASEKDRAELAMIVDVVRNDLGRVCQTGSVEVTGHAGLMTLPTVHHLYSEVHGRLRPDAGPADLLAAAFPAASITGAPKIEAMRIALREEGQLRGPCMGAIGWIGFNGDMELSVAIRTAFVSQGRVRYLAGCGITADSSPADEFEETRHKAAAFIRALGRETEHGW